MMLTTRAAFIRGLAAGVGVTLAAQALIWLLSPALHPYASRARATLMVAQLVCGILLAIRMTRGVGPGDASREVEDLSKGVNGER